MYINRYTYEGGNPFLLPSLSHNITLGTTYKWVYLSAGYQYIKDAIISFSGAYSEDDPTIALINMINAPDYDKIFCLAGFITYYGALVSTEQKNRM